MTTAFVGFPKIARLSREIVITEKLDGTNAQIYIGEDGEFKVGSRNRWITPLDDNFGFASWAYTNMKDLLTLGPGHHFGEWWGCGIQRGYGKSEKTFSLFNTKRWSENRPACCDVVPVLYEGPFHTRDIQHSLDDLQFGGSAAAPGFLNPEGIIIYHTAANIYFKKTIDKDDEPKSRSKTA